MKQSRNCWNLVIYATFILTCCFIIPAIAAGTETLISSNASADQAKPALYGNYIVWVDSRYGISQDIYLYNTATLQEYRITNGSAIVDSPDIQGNRVVWIQSGRDIYWYDIPTRGVHKVPLVDSSRFTPKISGDRIVWMEQQTFASGPHNDILMYDIGTNLTHNLTAGQPDTDQEKPAISGNVVVWEDHRRLYGNYDIYGIDTSSPNPATWVEKPVCSVDGDKTVPAIYGDIVVWQDYRIPSASPHIHSAYFSTTTEIWNSTRDDSFFDQQYSPSVYGDKVVWLDTWPDYNTHIGMYNSTSSLTIEPLTSALTSIPSYDYPPRIYQNRVVWGDIRSGPSQVYLYTDGIDATCPAADFTQDNATVKTGEMVHFLDTSAPVSATWYWEFGDGTNSTEQNPVHTFTSPGTYTVMLSVGNTSCRNTTPFGSHQVSVAAFPSVDFTAFPLTGMMPLMVTFNGTATGNPTSWNWDFGDGTTGTGQNVSHVYNAGGIYSVRLNATNSIGTGTGLKTNYIQVLSGGHEVATTPITGITIDNRFGGQFLTYNTGLLPDFSSSGSALVSHPPVAYGWKNVTFLTSDRSGFFANSSTVTGNLTGIIFQTNDIRPAGFSPNLGHFPSVSYQTALPLFPDHASLSTDIWESATRQDNLTYLNVIHQNGFSNINGLAYTMEINRANFGTPGDSAVTMSVSTDWVAGFEGIADGRNSTYIIATGYNSSGNYYGIVLPATYQFHDTATNLDYFSSDIPARYSFLSKFSLAKLSGSGNPFQLITLTVASHIGLGGGGGGSAPVAVQNTIAPEIKPPTLPDPGKTAKIYANLQGVITQATTLKSTDGLASVTIGEGIVAKDTIGKSLQSIAIKAIPADDLHAIPTGSAFAFQGMAYDLQPDNATFSPAITINYTVPQARWGQEFMVKTFDTTSGTWQDVPTRYNPNTGIVTAEVSHFCCFALFAKAVAPLPAITPVPAQLAPPVVAPPPPTAMSTFSGMILWIIGMVTKNVLIVAGIVILAVALFLYGRKRRRDRVMYLR